MTYYTLVGSINFKKVREFSEFLADTEGPITVILCSQGGDEGCGRAIAGLMRGRDVTVAGYGDIHSAAVLIFAAGNRRVLNRFATIMLHESETESHGNATRIKKVSKQMEADEKFWCDLMQECTGTDTKIWQKLHNEETYLRPEECLSLNLATELI